MPPIDRRSLLAGGAGLGLLAALGRFQSAHALTAEEELVEDCRITVQSLLSDPDFQWLDDYIVKAKGLAIFPALIKGGFILGGEGGTGVLLGRFADGSWSYPAFYYMGAASLGLQIGGQVSEVVLTIMSNKALDSVINDQLKFGGDMSIAVGPIGKGIGADTTTNFQADVYSFAKTAGLFGGVSFEGAGILKDDKWNAAYYGQGATPRGIVVEGKFKNPNTQGLLNSLSAY
jgi:lipid-binding SYLF domain-containing protein